MLVTVHVEVPVAVMNVLMREMEARGVPELREFGDFLTDAWHDVSFLVANDLGAFLYNRDVHFEGISLQVSNQKRVQFRFRNIEERHLIRLGLLLLEWADQQGKIYEELHTRLHAVVLG